MPGTNNGFTLYFRKILMDIPFLRIFLKIFKKFSGFTVKMAQELAKRKTHRINIKKIKMINLFGSR